MPSAPGRTPVLSIPWYMIPAVIIVAYAANLRDRVRLYLQRRK